MWGLFSKDPTKDFPYDTTEQIGELCLSNKTVWTLHHGKHRSSGDSVSVFTCDTRDGVVSNTQLEVARGAVKRLKTLRHPSVLTYVDSMETDKVVMLATEPVEPLELHLENLVDRGPKRDNYIAWGIFQVCRALSFLNNDAKLRHNNINSGSVFVNKSGEWKLAGLEYVSGADITEPPVKILPQLEKYDPPERQDHTKRRAATAWSADVWGLGCLIWEVYNGPLKAMEHLAKLNSIPKNLCPTYKECVCANPGKRPNPQDLIVKLRKSPGYFKNDLIDALLFLEEIQIKEDGDKSRFFSSLSPLLDNFPTNVCNEKILPQLINAFEYSNAGSAILTPVFKIGKNLETDEYQKKIVPCVVKLFSSNDRNARFKLLSQMENFVEHLSKQIVNDQVFPKIESGFMDSEPLIREKTVIATIHLASKLTYSNLDETVVMKHFSRLARDEQGGIRTNTTVCLGKIARFLHPKTRQQVLLPAFARTLKDPFPPARIAGINAIAATQQYFTIQETGCRVLPILSAGTIDPEKAVRDQSFRVVKGFVSKLEKVSDDPSLREEMEKEVGSTTPAIVTAASSWAGWAVGAVTAKFYKSPSPPKETKTDEKETAVAAATDKEEVEVVKRTEDLRVTGEKEKAAVVVDNGWDIEPVVEADNDGWDNDEDWGSLEEAGGGNKREEEEEPVDSFDWGATSHDPFADIGEAARSRGGGGSTGGGGSRGSTGGGGGSKVSEVASFGNSSGWDDWGGGESSSSRLGGGGTGSSSDEARKKREERKKERQKELEAKRAARGGPMKLGAKKNLD